MGFFSTITRAVTKPFKKIIKSPLGKAALIGGLGYLGGAQAGLWGPKAAGSQTGWLKALRGGWKGLPMGGEEGLSGVANLLYRGGEFAAANKVPLAIAGGLGLGTAAMAKGAKADEPSWAGDSGEGHKDYLTMRKLWDWGGEEPMFSANQGGRVGAQQGMYAGQGLGSLQGAEVGMSQVNQPADQGILEQASGTTDQGQSEDSELIMLIQQLASMGIPLEQLRGRTKEELVEMMIYLSSKAQRETGDVEQAQFNDGGRVGLDLGGNPGANEIFLDESTEVLRGGQDGDSIVEETENIEMAGDDTPPIDIENLDALRDSFFEVFGRNPVSMDELKKWASSRTSGAQGGITRPGYALGTPIIPSSDGMQLDMRDAGGYQPHGAKEKKDDVRALLAQGEFVMTSDAVRGLGGGDREAGAKKMYDMMHNLEAMA